MNLTKRIASTAGVALSLMLLSAACSGISTSTDYDPAANFGSYGSYNWTSSTSSVDALTDSRVKSAVDAALTLKGLNKVNSGGDLAVSYQITTSDQTTYNTVSTGWGGGYGRRGWGGAGMATSTTTEQHYTQGSVILGMFDAGTQNMVWKGTASDTVDPGKSPEDKAEAIQGAIDKMLKDFPPS